MENAMKHIHRTRGDRVFDAINVAALCLLLAVILYPLIYVLSCSFSDPLLVVQSKITFLPMQPTLVAYQRVFRNELIMTGYQNTLFYTLLGTVLNVAVTTMMAYPLSRHDFAARRPITMLTAFTMLFSGGMIPTFLVVKNLGLIDTVWSLVLPGLVSPWNMFIMKNYFQTSIPTELYEAASIDGADNFHLLRSVVLPLSAPIVAVMVLYYGVTHWNSYFNALLYLRDRTRYPLQLVLRSFFSANDYSEQGGAGGDSGMTALLVSETMKYALIVIASGPILCLYPLLQRFFVKGVRRSRGETIANTDTLIGRRDFLASGRMRSIRTARKPEGVRAVFICSIIEGLKEVPSGIWNFLTEHSLLSLRRLQHRQQGAHGGGKGPGALVKQADAARCVRAVDTVKAQPLVRRGA